MAQNITLSSGDWVNVWTRSGITPGTAVVLHMNGGPETLYVSTNASPSAANSSTLVPNAVFQVPAGTTNLFIRGSGSFQIQTAAEYAEYTEAAKSSAPVTVKLNADGTPSSVRPDYAAAVVGAAVTRINVGGSADTFILEV